MQPASGDGLGSHWELIHYLVPKPPGSALLLCFSSFQLDGCCSLDSITCSIFHSLGPASLPSPHPMNSIPVLPVCCALNTTDCFITLCLLSGPPLRPSHVEPARPGTATVMCDGRWPVPLRCHLGHLEDEDSSYLA